MSKLELVLIIGGIVLTILLIQRLFKSKTDHSLEDDTKQNDAIISSDTSYYSSNRNDTVIKENSKHLSNSDINNKEEYSTSEGDNIETDNSSDLTNNDESTN